MYTKFDFLRELWCTIRSSILCLRNCCWHIDSTLSRALVIYAKCFVIHLSLHIDYNACRIVYTFVGTKIGTVLAIALQCVTCLSLSLALFPGYENERQSPVPVQHDTKCLSHVGNAIKSPERERVFSCLAFFIHSCEIHDCLGGSAAHTIFIIYLVVVAAFAIARVVFSPPVAPTYLKRLVVGERVHHNEAMAVLYIQIPHRCKLLRAGRVQNLQHAWRVVHL